jgi:hypothetical protein
MLKEKLIYRRVDAVHRNYWRNEYESPCDVL